MRAHTIVPDFAKGLRDNYVIATDPHKTQPVNEGFRKNWQKALGVNKTQPVSKEDQVKKLTKHAVETLSNAELKTHFFKVMQDADRNSVFNLTSDVDAYCQKRINKQKKYAQSSSDQAANLSQKQLDKLAALARIEHALLPFTKRADSGSDETLEAGYFPYQTNIGASGQTIGKTELQSHRNAAGRWVFTGQMNGCAIAINHTLNPIGNEIQQGTVSHFPSPTSHMGKVHRWQQNQTGLTAWFGANGYGTANSPDGFNALYIKK